MLGSRDGLPFFMINAIIGKKIDQSQKFLSDGTRIPVTEIEVPDAPVVFVKNKNKDGYWAIQLGIGTEKKPSKAKSGHIRGAKLESTPRFLREIRLEDIVEDSLPKIGEKVKLEDVFKPGDMVDIIGVSKGKGYAGVVKRHHFKGGPRTHGQSDRERAPGSIGQTTTPGRVYKGKRMSGRMGQEKVTIKNLLVVEVTPQKVLIKGVVPGVRKSIVLITKIGEDKKFLSLYKEEIKEPSFAKATEGKENAN